ncbi:response regulator [Methylobrevis pamukkalensis]|uniref:Response regulator receiver domain protein n=1 Tax=Methylobrevis pamukkalensis TaxID=1439726 RepID=A0A1E3H3A8_9HYPH|nr:response regulator [Methylobrevis pamukkalensis]ODN70790.1 Response regulator receiver domain protein [Methylobrevis pamukkalensis]
MPGFHFDVVHVQTVEEALRAVRQDSFDLFLADYWLGAESSVSFVREVGAREDAPPIIVFSQLDHSDIQEIGFRAGASAFISKDLLAPELLGSTLRSVLHDSQRRQDLRFRLLASGDREVATARGVLDWLTTLSGRIDRIHTAAVLSRGMVDDAGEAAMFVDDIVQAASEIRQDLYGRVARLRQSALLGERSLARVDVAALVADTVRVVRAEAEKHGVRLDYVHPSIPVMVDCDPDGFKCALRLLLVGAIRHGGGRSALKLRIRIENGDLKVCLTEPGEVLRLDDDKAAADGELSLTSFVLDDHVSALMLVEAMLDRQGGRLAVARGDDGASNITLSLPIRQTA